MAKQHSTHRRKNAERVDHGVPDRVKLALLRAEETALAQALAKHGMNMPHAVHDQIELALIRHEQPELQRQYEVFREQLGIGPDCNSQLWPSGADAVWRELAAAAVRTRVRLVRPVSQEKDS
jgi:hypothetical protein